MAADPRVLHIYDAADVGATLIKYGRREGRPWRHFTAIPPEGAAPSAAARAGKLAAGSLWQARRAAAILRSDLLHVHSGSRIGVVRSRPVKPFLLHFHGTDIRTQYYEPARRPALQWGADHAVTVLYSTPDLREHAESARSDAVYLPNPVDLEELPQWWPAGRPRIVFASRWHSSKGGQQQLELARVLRAAVGPDVELQGLDWGDGAPQAAELGVILVPKMPKPEYLRWLASAHVVIGQSAGILAMSELQAMGIGVPVVMPLGEGYYQSPPVLQGDSAEALAAAAAAALADPAGTSATLAARTWLQEHHDPVRLVHRLAGIYAAAG
ncbi:glycosyltransferase [Arthrobacter sulfonylureivorans]|uniref:glycosyltransferase n=1 Tax=Arthrobacter sulfonylureivorans TaxID=2486855 RepID=UPI0039E22BC7